MVRVRTRIQNPFDRVAPFPHEAQDAVRIEGGRLAGLLVIIVNGIDDDAFCAFRIRRDILDRSSPWIVEARHFRFLHLNHPCAFWYRPERKVTGRRHRVSARLCLSPASSQAHAGTVKGRVSTTCEEAGCQGYRHQASIRPLVSRRKTDERRRIRRWCLPRCPDLQRTRDGRSLQLLLKTVAPSSTPFEGHAITGLPLLQRWHWAHFPSLPSFPVNAPIPAERRGRPRPRSRPVPPVIRFAPL